MIVTVFRSRMNPGALAEYGPMAARMSELARAIPGYVAHKGFVADDGERVTIVEFESEEALQEWRRHPEHHMAKNAGETAFSASSNSRFAASFKSEAGPRRRDPIPPHNSGAASFAVSRVNILSYPGVSFFHRLSPPVWVRAAEAYTAAITFLYPPNRGFPDAYTGIYGPISASLSRVRPWQARK